MVGCAIGDALGASFGGLLIGDVERSGFPSFWADDAHMTIGVAESFIADGGFDADHMALVFTRNLEAEPCRGYGLALLRFLG